MTRRTETEDAEAGNAGSANPETDSTFLSTLRYVTVEEEDSDKIGLVHMCVYTRVTALVAKTAHAAIAMNIK